MVMIITNLLGSRNGLPWENAAAWERISPYNDVKISYSLGGSDDWNVPIPLNMYLGMKRLGRETQLGIYDDHGLKDLHF
jgi:hypothetical protein